ncbi:MAG: PEGA domain-containing protein [Deltaproteobacteria bacterium]|nr:PEGA domain-containing protein [Deltaproteobacteria bacterium]
MSGPLLAAPAAVPVGGPQGVVAAHAEDVGIALDAARSTGGRWTSIQPERPQPDSPTRTVRALKDAYLEADFLRCLVLSHEPAAQLHTLITAHHLPEASEVGTIGAACLAAVGETERAREAVRRLLALRLPPPVTLTLMRPDFKAMVQEEAKAQEKRKRHPLAVKTQPASADVSVDGKSLRCGQGPCVIALDEGEHFVSASMRGYRSSSVALVVEGPTSVTVSLDPASSREALAQWSEGMAAKQTLLGVDMLRAAAVAGAADVAVAVAPEKPQVFRAALYDYRQDKIVAQGRAPSAFSAVRIAIMSWHDQNKPPLISRATWIWGSVGIALVSAGVATYLLARDTSTRYDLVFQPAP